LRAVEGDLLVDVVGGEVVEFFLGSDLARVAILDEDQSLGQGLFHAHLLVVVVAVDFLDLVAELRNLEAHVAPFLFDDVLEVRLAEGGDVDEVDVGLRVA